VLNGSRVWVNGDEAEPDTPVGDDDEVAVIPPVSGGCE
jgi:molybdopterin converting factor small subunit